MTFFKKLSEKMLRGSLQPKLVEGFTQKHLALSTSRERVAFFQKLSKKMLRGSLQPKLVEGFIQHFEGKGGIFKKT